MLVKKRCAQRANVYVCHKLRMAPRHRIAHQPKFTEALPLRRPVDPVQKNFLLIEATETKTTRRYTVKAPVQRIPEKEDPHSFRPVYQRTFESRLRNVPRLIEEKIHALLQLNEKSTRKSANRRRISPISEDYDVHAHQANNRGHASARGNTSCKPAATSTPPGRATTNRPAARCSSGYYGTGCCPGNSGPQVSRAV